MTDYLGKSFDLESPDFISTYDELTLWAAPFGLMLLDRVRLGAEMRVLDVGCGAGFPLLELAQRLGHSSTVYGIDIWRAALDRAKLKALAYGANNVQFVEGDAASMDFADDFFDLVVSNLGINNFADPDSVLRECHRVMKPEGYLSLTTNFKGHMSEYYHVFEKTLRELGLSRAVDLLEAHVEHRSDPAATCSRLEQAGFKITDMHTASFRIRFLNGSSLLRHHFIQLGFLEGWKGVVPEERLVEVFSELEEGLNSYAQERGELSLTIPYGYIEGKK